MQPAITSAHHPPPSEPQVGLPARGKSFVSKKVQRYLLSTGNEAKVFNAGQYRRQAHKAGSVESEMAADFFNNLNPESAALREEFAMAALEDLLEYVHEGDGKVGIHDATNSSVKRRQKLVQRCKKAGTPVLFIESCCIGLKPTLFFVANPE